MSMKSLSLSTVHAYRTPLTLKPWFRVMDRELWNLELYA